MFEIHFVDGNSCPVIVCDMCGERLKEVGKAATVFRTLEADRRHQGQSPARAQGTDRRTHLPRRGRVPDQSGGRRAWLAGDAHDLG
jgi:hypothetical protein